MKRLIIISILLFTFGNSGYAEQCAKIKGLMSEKDSGLKYYLTPEHYLYSKIKTLHTERGERCFETEKEAKDAGFFKLPNKQPKEQQQMKVNPTQKSNQHHSAERSTLPPKHSTISIPQWAITWKNTPYSERIEKSKAALIAVNSELKNDRSLHDKAINLEACVSEATKGEESTMFKSLAQCMTACVIMLEYAE